MTIPSYVFGVVRFVRTFFVVSYARNSIPVAGKVRNNVGPRPLYKGAIPVTKKV